MTKYLRVTLVAAAFVVVGAAFAGDASAQQCGVCHDQYEGEVQRWKHAFGSGAVFMCDGPGSAGCHGDWYWGLCSNYHNPGDECFPYDDEADALFATAIEDADAIQVAGLLRDYGGFSKLDVAGGEILLLNCQGDIVKKLSVADHFLATLLDR